jgi:hypothetical protein
VGTVRIVTPLLSDPLEGSVYLAAQGENPFGTLLALYIVVEGHGVVVKLAGRIDADPNTGRLTATFDNNPQLPFSNLKVDFFAGDRAALTTPGTCGSSDINVDLSSWARPNSSLAQVNALPVTSGPDGSGCVGSLSGQPFAPGFLAGTVSPQAGAFTPFTLSLSRSEGQQNLNGLALRMPAGVLGKLAGVPRCEEPQAAQGACGSGSLIGHVTTGAGSGPSPFYIGGNVYLTGPYAGGPFGLAIVVHALAGPFDLGNVIVRSRIDVDPRTAQITVTSDPFPRILQGIPLDIRSVNVTIDRDGFIFNPTSCDPMSVTGMVSSTQGVSVPVSNRFQAANCAGLAFRPSFKVSTKAKTSKQSGASLDVWVASGAGQANIGKVAVSLPKQLPSRLTTIQQACPEATFNQNPASCPVGSNIGVATATTPVLVNPVVGPAYLVSHGGAAFPDLVLILQGEGVTVQLVGSIDIKKGVTSSAFNSVPDVPISTFELTLPQGSHSGLAANLPEKAKGSLCGQGLVMPTTITGQNGAQVKQSTKIAVTGCAKAKKKARKHSRHSRVKLGSGAKAKRGSLRSGK